MDNEVRTFQELGKEKGLKLVHLNIRSLLKKVEQLKILTQDIDMDVLTLSETWLNSSINSNLVKLEGYTLYRQDRIPGTSGKKSKKRGGGLLTYVRSEQAANCELLSDICVSSPDIEAQWTLMHRSHCKDIVICNLYRPPSGKLEKALSHIDENLKSLDLGRLEVFILGDLNVNYKNKSSGEYKRLNFLMQANGLTQLISSTTRNTDKTNSLLDLILTNSKYISKAGTLEHFISDHQPIFVVKKKRRDKRPQVEFEGRSYRNFDKEQFKKKLIDNDWSQFYKVGDPEAAWEYILNRLMPILGEMCPIRKFKLRTIDQNGLQLS